LPAAFCWVVGAAGATAPSPPDPASSACLLGPSAWGKGKACWTCECGGCGQWRGSSSVMMARGRRQWQGRGRGSGSSLNGWLHRVQWWASGEAAAVA
jgi:hypothetical protein